MKKKKIRNPKLGAEFALVSRRNRVFGDRKKEENKMKCRKGDKNALSIES